MTFPNNVSKKLYEIIGQVAERTFTISELSDAHKAALGLGPVGMAVRQHIAALIATAAIGDASWTEASEALINRRADGMFQFKSFLEAYVVPEYRNMPLSQALSDIDRNKNWASNVVQRVILHEKPLLTQGLNEFAMKYIESISSASIFLDDGSFCEPRNQGKNQYSFMFSPNHNRHIDNDAQLCEVVAHTWDKENHFTKLTQGHPYDTPAVDVSTVTNNNKNTENVAFPIISTHRTAQYIYRLSSLMLRVYGYMLDEIYPVSDGLTSAWNRYLKIRDDAYVCMATSIQTFLNTLINAFQKDNDVANGIHGDTIRTLLKAPIHASTTVYFDTLKLQRGYDKGPLPNEDDEAISRTLRLTIIRKSEFEFELYSIGFSKRVIAKKSLYGYSEPGITYRLVELDDINFKKENDLIDNLNALREHAGMLVDITAKYHEAQDRDTLRYKIDNILNRELPDFDVLNELIHGATPFTEMAENFDKMTAKLSGN